MNSKHDLALMQAINDHFGADTQVYFIESKGEWRNGKFVGEIGYELASHTKTIQEIADLMESFFDVYKPPAGLEVGLTVRAHPADVRRWEDDLQIAREQRKWQRND